MQCIHSHSYAILELSIFFFPFVYLGKSLQELGVEISMLPSKFCHKQQPISHKAEMVFLKKQQ